MKLMIKANILQNLIYMLSFVKKLEIKTSDAAKLSTTKNPFIEVLIREFAKSLFDCLKRITPKKYIREEDNLNYVKANDIEKILTDIEDLIHGMEQYFVYSGVANSGQSRMWQNRFRRTTYTEQSGTQFITSDNLVFYDSNNNKFIVKE